MANRNEKSIYYVFIILFFVAGCHNGLLYHDKKLAITIKLEKNIYMPEEPFNFFMKFENKDNFPLLIAIYNNEQISYGMTIIWEGEFVNKVEQESYHKEFCNTESTSISTMLHDNSIILGPKRSCEVYIGKQFFTPKTPEKYKVMVTFSNPSSKEGEWNGYCLSNQEIVIVRNTEGK